MSFLWRRRRGLIKGVAWAAIVGGGGYLLGQYALKRFLEWQASSAYDRALQDALKRQFAQNQTDSVATVHRFVRLLRSQIDAVTDVDGLTERWRRDKDKSLSREEKVARWDEIKLASAPTRRMAPSHDMC